MTPEEFEKRMRECFPPPPDKGRGYDKEVAHGNADQLMCDLLTELGYGKGVEVFENADKWYA
jgi:hypothetical protein